MDYRVQPKIYEYLIENKLLGHVDIPGPPGGSQDLAKPPAKQGLGKLIDIIKLSKKLHDIDEVFLFNHIDCGAYGGRSASQSETQEIQMHLQEMRRAKSFINETLPQLKVRMFVLYIDSNDTVTLKEH